LIDEPKGKSGKTSHFEAIKGLLEKAVLSPSERKKLKEELEQSEEGGSGTNWLESWAEFQKISETFEGRMLSPGGAAALLGVSRARIHQLEAEGKIKAYRYKDKEISDEDFKDSLKGVPFWARPLVKKPKPGSFVYIPVVDLEDYKKHMRKKNKS
jgi:hypothetical protein